MLDPDEIAHMLHRPRDAGGRQVAHRGVPIADADQPAGRGDPANFGVGEVAVDLARRLHPAVARYHRAPRHFERSEEHTSELQSLMRISYAVFCWKKKIRMTKMYHEFSYNISA